MKYDTQIELYAFRSRLLESVHNVTDILSNSEKHLGGIES